MTSRSTFVKPLLAAAALAAGVITKAEAAKLERATQLRDEVVRVDHFPQDMGAAESARQLDDARSARAFLPHDEYWAWWLADEIAYRMSEGLTGVAA